MNLECLVTVTGNGTEEGIELLSFVVSSLKEVLIQKIISCKLARNHGQDFVAFNISERKDLL